ncbi:UNVERIFIED_CONTAM: hypothetical protein HDU68_001865 [Siphonaria sp. JEL0065]|nr:hypothetical protein HDU68_001865 [Siphonaria sp. JEL0065]
MQKTQPKKRTRISFAVECIANELNNLPYVSGYYYLKWRVYAAGSAGNTAASSSAGGSGARGITHRATVRDHTVVWNAALATSSAVEPALSNTTAVNTTDIVAPAAAAAAVASLNSPLGHSSVEVSMATDRDGYLLPCELLLVVKQEANGGRGAENVGSVTINLSELANQSQPTVKRYLLQESKVNSTLKVTISMKLTKGLFSDYKLPASTPKVDNIISLEVIRDMFSAEGQKTNLHNTLKDSETLLTPSEADPGSSASSALALGATSVDLSFYDETDDFRVVETIFNKVLRQYTEREGVE